MLKKLRSNIQKNRFSIFYKLLATYLCISIPIYVMYMCLYQYAMEQMKKETSTFFSNQANFFLDEWEKEIENINNMMQYFTVDNDVETVAVIPQSISYYNRVFRMNQIARKLSLVQYSSKYTVDTTLYLPSVQKQISAKGGIDDLDTELFHVLEEKLRNSVDGFVFMESEKDTLLLAVSQPLIRGGSSLNPSYILLTTLSFSRIQQSLSSFAFTENTETLLVHPGTTFAISSSGGHEEKLSYGAAERIESLPETVSIGGGSYQTFLATSDRGSFYLACFVPEDELYPFTHVFNLWMAGFFLLVLLMIVVFSKSIYRFIKKPIDALIVQFQGDDKGNLQPYFGYKDKDEFQSLFGSYNTMVARIRNLIDQVYFQKLLAQKAELKQLQAQVNPHFLYNSFFTLSLLARSGDTEQVSEFASRLGEYFKYITRNAREAVTLRQEYEHALQYAEIQKIRFKNRVSISMEPPPVPELMVPKLILQPLLENAFVHGLEQKGSDAVLRVQFESAPNILRVIFDDNGGLPQPEQLEGLRRKLDDRENTVETTALVNIHRRLSLFYSNPSGIDVGESPLGGWRVRVNIYYKQADSNMISK